MNSRDLVSRFCSNICMWRQSCFNVAHFRSRSSSIFATLTFSLRFFFFCFYLSFFLSTCPWCHNILFLWPAHPLHFASLSLLFSPKHSVFCRQTQLIAHYVMLTVAQPGDRTQCAVRRTTSTVVSRQRLCVVVLYVLGLPTAGYCFPVSDELWGCEVSFDDPVA